MNWRVWRKQLQQVAGLGRRIWFEAERADLDRTVAAEVARRMTVVSEHHNLAQPAEELGIVLGLAHREAVAMGAAAEEVASAVEEPAVGVARSQRTGVGDSLRIRVLGVQLEEGSDRAGRFRNRVPGGLLRLCHQHLEPHNPLQKGISGPEVEAVTIGAGVKYTAGVSAGGSVPVEGDTVVGAVVEAEGHDTEVRSQLVDHGNFVDSDEESLPVGCTFVALLSMCTGDREPAPHRVEADKPAVVSGRSVVVVVCAQDGIHCRCGRRPVGHRNPGQACSLVDDGSSQKAQK